MLGEHHLTSPAHREVLGDQQRGHHGVGVENVRQLAERSPVRPLGQVPHQLLLEPLKGARQGGQVQSEDGQGAVLLERG